MSGSRTAGHYESGFIKTTLVIKACYALFYVFLFAAAACSAAMIIYCINPYNLAVTEIHLLLCMGLYLMYKKHHYTGAVEMIKTTAAKIEDTQLQLSAFNEHINTLNKFTKRLSEETDKAEICNLVTRTLVNEFNFDSSQFWLLNSKDNRLECMSVTGYSDKMLPQLIGQKGTGPVEQKLRQLFQRVLFEKKTLTFKNISNPKSSKESDINFLCRMLGLTDFAVAPLYTEEQTIGVLTVECQSIRTKERKDGRTNEFFSPASEGKNATGILKFLEEKDRLLLESITKFVGDALDKIELFQDMAQKIEKRARKLKKINEELLRTKELAIQSEKLSSLGRMAAGVLHEINDPLNFLVNILADIRRDIQGLEKTKILIQECVTDRGANLEIERIAEKYDIEAHLQEMEFVFDRATKALNKIMRIAGSLNVFTSSSKQEKSEVANLLEVAQDTIDLIPKNVLGETKISVRGEEACTWPVHRSEMRQVFTNLVINAVDAMEKKGAIEIWGEKKNHTVIVSICDTGPGIPAEIQNQIFDPFFTTKPAGQGTGLGLSMSAEIVHKFGGNLTVESIEGQGTCFHIRFLKET